MSQKPIEERVPEYEIMVTNAIKDVQISSELTIYGYPIQVLNVIKKDVVEVKDALFAFTKEYGEQFQSTRDFEQAQIKAHKYYMRLVKFARILFADDISAYTALMLNGIRKENYGGWLVQVQTFYNNLLSKPEYLEAMATLNCSKAVINKGKALLTETVNAKAQQEIERGEAQIATVLRDEKLEVLDEKMSRFKSVCTVVFEDEPQVLEKLGIVKE